MLEVYPFWEICGNNYRQLANDKQCRLQPCVRRRLCSSLSSLYSTLNQPWYCSSLTFYIQSADLPSSCSTMETCVMAAVAMAPCQCFSPGGNQITSPGRISSTGPPQLCAKPQPAVTISVWPSG